MTLSLITTTPSDAEFLAIFNRLSVALREQQDDSGVTQGIYFDVLKDLPSGALEAGAQALMREPGRRFFPTTTEWRTAAEQVQQQRLREAIQPAREEPWRLECDHCDDSGWESFECTGDAFCGHARKHARHTFVRPCSCRPTNRTYARHHHFGSDA